MKDILLKNITKGKKRLSLILAMVMTVSGIGDLGFIKNKETVHAGETGTVVFAEGYGTGKDFNTNSWKFAGQALNGSSTYDISNNTNGPKIVNNNHSSEQEKIIRLINGVKVGDSEGNEAGSSFQDYRSGEAFLKNGIKFASDSAFSMKFTFSMPDAVVNTDKTGGAEYAREVGGDGIAFLLTTNSTHNTQAGSGIGYQGIDNSVAIEIDSFFNGAYCDMNAVTGTAYKNWGFDNQLYFHKKWQLNGSTSYSDSNNPYGNDSYEDDIDYVPYRNYKFAERFDHIGITRDGEVKKHEAIAYINGLNPTEKTAHTSGEGTYYTFDNLAYFTGETMGKGNIKNEGAFSSIYNASPKKSSIQEDSTNTCSTRFADKNVNNRLFTVWVDYDGSIMYVRYANGNFKTAVRPTNALITKTIDMSSFDGKTVYMGFTSAVGSSKANHTIHSFYFTNEFLNDDPKTKYTEEYYVETLEATADSIEVEGKHYVKKETDSKTDIKLGSSVSITNKSNDAAYKNYTLVDYSLLTDSYGNKKYPKTVSTVAPDGSTVLYQFYDLKSANFTCKYYLEVDANTPGADFVNNKYFLLQDEVTNSEIIGTTIDTECDDITGNYFAATKNSIQIDNTKKSYQYFKPDYETTIGAGNITDDVRGDNSLVFKYYYNRIITKYTEMYYVQDDTATTSDVLELDINGTMTKFVPKTEKTNVVNNVKAGSEANITNLSGDETFKEYTLLDEITQESNGYYSTISNIAEDGTTIVYQFYTKIPKYDYSVEYYVEVDEADKDSTAIYAEGKWYNLNPDKTETKNALDGTDVEVAVNSEGTGVKAEGVEVDGTFKKIDGYSYNSTATQDNGQSAGTVSSAGLTIQILFDKNASTTTSYEGRYYLELEDQTSTDFDAEFFDEFGRKIKYKLDTEKSYTVNDVDKKSSATINNESEYYKDTYADRYVLLPETTEHPYHVADIDDDGKTIVYQIYRLRPKYTVKYYIEVPKGTAEAIHVPDIDKYYKLQSDKTVTKLSYVDTVVNVVSEKNNEEAGVSDNVNGVVKDTMKSFEKYNYSSATTIKNGKYTSSLDWNTEYIFEIFYDKKTTQYTEIYLVEMKDQSSPTCDALINGILYEKLEADVEVTGKDIDSSATITDKSNSQLYAGYKLITPSPEGYPSSVLNIADEGTTKVYQVYALPSYTVKYYKETFENKENAIPHNGKYYELQSNDTFVKKATAGTIVEYIMKTDSLAGVKEGNIELGINGYDKYKFNEELTKSNGKSKIEVSKTDTENIVELFFDAEPTKYTMKYLIEVEDDEIKPGDKIIEIGVTKYKVNEEKEVTNLPLNATAEIEDKKGEEPYVNYELQKPTDEYPSKVDKIKDDGTTVVYQIYNIKPEYTVNYWVEVKPGESYDREVDGKYYRIETDETVTNKTSTGTKVEYGTNGDNAGVKENGSNILNTFKNFIEEGFKFSDDSTKENGKISGTASKLTDLIIELFFDKNRTKYTEMYLVEVVNPLPTDVIIEIDGVKYKVEETHEVPNVRIDSGAEIKDKSTVSPYTGYELITPPEGYPSKVKDINDKGETIVYQVYNLPSYTVKYYKEVPADTEGAIKIEETNKYYELQSSDTETFKAPYSTVVAYVKTDDVTAGVKENDVNVGDSLKSYEEYKFSTSSTEAYGKATGTIEKGTDLVIELFYDKFITEYKEKYWIEDPNATENFVEIEINSEIKKFVLSETNGINNVKPGGNIDVTDKSDEYKNYELVEVEIPNYPSSDAIKEDGSTVVHQIYVLKPTYEVQYYVEVKDKTDEAIEVDGKYYVIKSEESITKYAFTGTIVSATTNADKAGVKEADVEVTDTFKKFDGYTFSKKSTDANGKVGGKVTHDDKIVVMLMYDLVVAQEEPTTPEETTTIQPTTPSTPVSTGDNVNSIFMILILCSGFVAMVLMAGKKKSEN